MSSSSPRRCCDWARSCYVTFALLLSALLLAGVVWIAVATQYAHWTPLLYMHVVVLVAAALYALGSPFTAAFVPATALRGALHAACVLLPLGAALISWTAYWSECDGATTRTTQLSFDRDTFRVNALHESVLFALVIIVCLGRALSERAYVRDASYMHSLYADDDDDNDIKLPARVHKSVRTVAARPSPGYASRRTARILVDDTFMVEDDDSGGSGGADDIVIDLVDTYKAF